MEITSVALRFPDDVNAIVGQAHFIKTVEDIAEIVVTTVPEGQYGLAFNESSGPCLIRTDGNDAMLEKLAVDNAKAIAAGHAFVLLVRGFYPISILGRLKDCPEVCSIFCATANPIEVIVAESALGRGILGVIDGAPPRGVETERDVAERKSLLRTLGYKR